MGRPGTLDASSFGIPRKGGAGTGAIFTRVSLPSHRLQRQRDTVGSNTVREVLEVALKAQEDRRKPHVSEAIVCAQGPSHSVDDHFGGTIANSDDPAPDPPFVTRKGVNDVHAIAEQKEAQRQHVRGDSPRSERQNVGVPIARE